MNDGHIESLSGFMASALRAPNPVLFAGAGVACRAGFPDWPAFLEHLASACDEFGDAASAVSIRQRAQRKNYLGAATVFKTCDTIPEGERWKILAARFLEAKTTSELDRLQALISLPFSAIVTTNYDSSLHQVAAALRGWFSPVERGDGSLRGASLRRDFFIARIHGRADVPVTMVVDSEDYRRLENDPDYLDFLLDILRLRSCLFVGFSFLDPAIQHVLRIYEQKCGPTFFQLHRAVVASTGEELISRLHSLNIDVAPYDSSDSHRDLWRAIRETAQSIPQRAGDKSEPQATTPLTGPPIHRFVAFAYSQLRSRSERQPLTELVQNGLILTHVAEGGEGGISQGTLTDKIAPLLGISREEAQQIVRVSVERLVIRKQLQQRADLLTCVEAQGNPLEDHLRLLGNSICDRMRVREQARVAASDRDACVWVLESLFMSRAWDLGAHFAGSETGWGADLFPVIRDQVHEAARRFGVSSLAAMERAIWDLLAAPEDREAILLSRIGRAAFGVQLVLSTPRQVLFQRHVLPNRVYLDSNVVMPAITSGHPLSPVYVDSLKRLAEAQAHLGMTLDVVVGDQFLNEIVTHRRLAQDLVRDLNLDDPTKLRKHILFYSAINTNVFVGAYATHVGRGKERPTFDQFLDEVAPYENEHQLADLLATLNIQVTAMRYVEEHQESFGRILGRLKQGYSSAHPSWRPEKPTVLIEHEAQQLTRLRADETEGVRSLFVTADTWLRTILQRDPELHAFAGSSVSHVGLVALVDLLVGVDADDRSYARLIWACPHTDEERAILDYFVKLALRDYQEGMALEMEQAAERVASQAAAAVREERRALFAKDPAEVARNARFLDRYENMFFKYWREAIEKREAERD
jgi:hypothetical protein